MTDNEIIKALECCTGLDHFKCAHCHLIHTVGCSSKLKKYALDLINRQKAEIKALNTENKQLQSDVITANQYYEYTKEQLEKAIKISQRSNRRFKEAKKELQNAKSEVERLERHTEMYHEVRAEAVKEFAERLKGCYIKNKIYDRPNAHTLVGFLFYQIDTLVAEMVGDTK